MTYPEGPVMEAHTAGFVTGHRWWLWRYDNPLLPAENADDARDDAAIAATIRDLPDRERRAWEAGWDEAVEMCEEIERFENFPGDFPGTQAELDELDYAIGSSDGVHYDQCAHWQRPGKEAT